MVGCCDECVGLLGGGDNNYRVDFDDVLGDGVCDGGYAVTDECGADGAVVGLVEGSNAGYVEGYSRWESGG